MDKKLKTPKQLSEEKQFKLFEDLSCDKIENEISDDKKFLSPKIFFGEKNFKHNVKCIDTREDFEIDVNSIIFELCGDVNSLKENIEDTKRYNREIKFLKKYIKNLEGEILKTEEFDPTNLYKNISSLRKEIEKVRKEIPSIPEPILYDEQLENLKNMILNIKESIPVVPEIKYYDEDLNELLESVENVKTQVEQFPEVRYYDHQINLIEEKILDIKESIPEIPEIKYYDEDIDHLQEKINEVKNSIPTIPEIKYYDEEIGSLEYKIRELKTELSNIPSFPEVKYYDEDIKNLSGSLNEIKNVIKELPEPKYYEEELELFDKKIEILKTLIPKPQIIPEIKYYDNEIKELKDDIKLLSDKILSIKIPDTKKYNDRLDKFYKEFDEKNTILNDKIQCLEQIFEYFNETEGEFLEEESIITEPPETNNQDHLTPLTQQFVTFKQLQDHYKTFINRIQQQLSTLGGGGETQLKYLDDVVGIATNASAYDGKYLRYNHSIRKFEFSQVIGDGGEFEAKVANLFDVDTSNLNNGYLMVYNESTETFVFVNPQTYFGINADYNPDPSVDDYGTY